MVVGAGEPSGARSSSSSRGMTVRVKYPSLMKLGTTYTSRMAGSNSSGQSRKDGSSFQNTQATSANTPRRRMAAACARLGAPESGLTVEPCPTMSRAEKAGADMVDDTRSVRSGRR